MITIPIPRALLLSLNDSTTYKSTMRPKKTLRQLGLVHGRNSRLKLDRARLDVWLSWPDKQRRDRHNYIPTIKHLIDGMVDAGILPDDDDEHLEGPLLHTSKQLCDKRLALVLDFDWRPLTADEVIA